MKRPTLAAVFDGYGGVEQVRIEQLPRPEPGPGQLLVQVMASGVSHMDAYVREGRFQDAVPLTLPAREGSSFSGIVRSVGAGVHGLKAGAEVFGHDPGHGAHATHLVVDAGSVVKKPERLPWEVAGALYLVGLTAFSLLQPLRVDDGDTVLVSAAAGGVGHIECQLARLAGAHVIGVAGTENHDYLRSIGVKPVGYGDGMEERIRTAADGRRITVLLDNYGHYEDLARALGVPPDRIVTSDQRRETEVRLYLAPPDARLRTQLTDVAELVSEWGLRVLVSGFYPFPSLDRALQDLAAGHSRGVVVVGMNATAPAGEYLRGTMRAHHERPIAAV